MITAMSTPDPAGPRLAPVPFLAPFIKWPGGKSEELAAIAAAAPPLTGRLIDPFVGGGSVLLATPAEVPAWANDACADLARLYLRAASLDGGLARAMESVAGAWDGFGGLEPLYAELAAAFLSADDDRARGAIASHEPAWLVPLTLAGPGLIATFTTRLERDLPVKFARMRRVQATLGRDLSRPDLLANIEGAVRAAFYMAIRQRYNEARRTGRWDDVRSADFLFLRELAYAAMFRFNVRGEFNVPYGGITYNRKSLADKVRALHGARMLGRLRSTEWRSLDFEAFLAEAAPDVDDFVFVDPPYDSEFSAYDDLPFDMRDQRRLRDVLESLRSRVMVVIKDTPMVRELYGGDRWAMAQTAKTYMWTIKSRNDRRATHLTITNYAPTRPPAAAAPAGRRGRGRPASGT
jgi:DNA adenine methylase